MRLRLIKHLNKFIDQTDEDYLKETIAVLEELSGNSALKEEELDLLGELLSNMYGTLEVRKLIKEGKKEAINAFMKRVSDSVD